MSSSGPLRGKRIDGTQIREALQVPVMGADFDSMIPLKK
jgi:hypothetical protein